MFKEQMAYLKWCIKLFGGSSKVANVISTLKLLVEVGERVKA